MFLLQHVIVLALGLHFLILAFVLTLLQLLGVVFAHGVLEANVGHWGDHIFFFLAAVALLFPLAKLLAHVHVRLANLFKTTGILKLLLLNKVSVIFSDDSLHHDNDFYMIETFNIKIFQFLL